MVITTSEARTTSSVSGFGYSLVRSSPISDIAATTAGSSSEAGREPADRTRILPLASTVSRAAAIWERPAFCTQTNSTSGTALVTAPLDLARALSRSLAKCSVVEGKYVLIFAVRAREV